MSKAENWRSLSACNDLDPDLFFPISSTGRGLLQIEEAKAVCSRCPVIEPCLQLGLESSIHGVFGGTTEDERRRMKRQRANAEVTAGQVVMAAEAAAS